MKHFLQGQKRGFRKQGNVSDLWITSYHWETGPVLRKSSKFSPSTCESTKMHSFRFGEFLLDVQERRLLRNGEPVPLTPKVFDTLVYLVEHQKRLVEKNELLEAVWSDSHVEEGNLARTIHVLRRALGNGEGDAKFIETVPTKGYRFVADATLVADRAQAQSIREAEPSKRGALVAAIVTVLLISLVALTGLAWRNHRGSRRLVPLTVSGAAYTKYQTGRLYLERQHGGDYTTALENFEAAIKLDPRFALAYAGKADAQIFLYWETDSHDDIAQARLALSRAIELDPGSSYAHALLCRIHATYDWDFAGAETECRRAVKLDPDNHEARREFAFLLNSLGRKDDALKEMDAAIALAPTSFNKRSRGLLLYYSRRFDEAIAQLKQVEATDPEYTESSRWLMRCFEQKKDYTEALEYLIRFRTSTGAESEEIAHLRRAFKIGGWPEVLRVSLAKAQTRPNLETAGILAQLGENDRAIEVLDGMIRDRRVMIVHMDTDPRLDPLRSDPRFEQLVNRVGLRCCG
jgi:DNA-binding winged helix-turn-helix (wHTH) protein